MRKSKTLAQQARYYEVESELEMMGVMMDTYINGNFKDFKDYYRTLCKDARRTFIHFLWNQTDERTFFRMVDMLMFG